jgi:Fe-S cluster assembly protein SufD
MNAMTVAAKHPWLEALFAGYEPSRSGASWLNERRAHALERANALSVPTTRDEEWRFTDITPLTRMHFQPPAGARSLAAADVASFVSPEATTQLVFVDGIYSPDHSISAGLPYGVVVSHLAAALGTHGAVIEPLLARQLEYERDVFTAINTSHLRDGAFVWIARDQKCPTPVQLLFISTQPETASYPRCLIVAEPGAECTVIEHYASLADAAYFCNAATEIVVRRGARVEHVKLQQEARSAFHISACATVLEQDAFYAAYAVTLGARISRQDLRVIQRGEGARAQIDGLTLVAGRQLADTHTVMDHARPNGKCRQLNKCIVGGAAHAVFSGKIFVRPGAQLTDSAQESRNLLLSDKAHVDAKPQLEIFADDVKCTHGATVGQLDAEQLFYLRSRGLAEGSARNLLTYAFGAEVIDRIPVPSLVEQLENVVLTQTQTAENQ